MTPGEYHLSIDARGGEGDWQLAWRAIGKLTPGQSVEPNERQEWAVAWPEGKPVVTGRFHGRNDNDFWRFSVSGEPQLGRAQLQGKNLFDMELHDARGKLQELRAGSSERIRLDSLYLTPGEYFLAVSGTDS